MSGQSEGHGVTGMKTMHTRTLRRLFCGLSLGLAALAAAPEAEAQEIQVTGPLAGAPAVRKLRLYREGRFEIAPAVSFTLLDEYQRQIFFGARLNYNFTDWLAIGVWGAYGPDPTKISTGLSDEIQTVNETRRRNLPADDLNRQLTRINLGPNFEDQLGTIDWIAAPQITLVPFRGKIALFQSIFVDTDLYFFGGPAFVGVKERADCAAGTCQSNFNRESRVAIAPTFGLGLSFFVNKWNAFGFEWRGLPFARNTGGFDNKGRDPDGEFPDLQINGDDREFKFNQMLTVSYGFFFPTMPHISE